MQTIKLTVQNIVHETKDAIAIYFKDELGQIPHFWPGQFLTLVLNINGQSVRRSYSICTSPTSLPEIGVCVKRVEGGLVSNHLVDTLKIGDTLDVLEPYGNFTLNYKMANMPTLVLVGAGSGITPLMSIIKSVLSTGSQSKIHLFYGNRNEHSIIFKEQLDQLAQNSNGKLSITHLLSQAGEGFSGIKSRIEGKLLQSLCNESALFDDLTANFYICGPDGMMHAVLDMLEAQGIPKERVHKESFFLAHKSSETTTEELSTDADPNDDGSRMVKLKLDGSIHEIKVPKGNYILETALAHGLDLPYACTMGVCGMCRATKVQGEMLIEEQEAISDTEIEEGACLTCVGMPVSHDLLIDYDMR